MLNADPKTVIFDDGVNPHTYVCTRVEYGLEYLGDVEEEFDWDLVENFEDVRLLIYIEMVRTGSEAMWLARDFLISTSKSITIDGEEINVVNDMKKTNFELWNNSNVKTKLKLYFKKKEKGLPTWIVDAGFIRIGGAA